MLRDKKQEIMNDHVCASRIAIRQKEKEKYKYRFVVLSRKTLFIYKNPEELKFESKMSVSFSAMDYFEDRKKGTFILRVSFLSLLTILVDQGR